MRFYIETLGCKVNQYESAAISALLAERGHVASSVGEPCDVAIVNTCAVTGDASRQSRQTARRLKKLFPDAKLAVCGCASQIDPDAARALGADLIAGTGDKRGLADAIEKLTRVVGDTPRGTGADPYGDDFALPREFEPLPSGAVPGRTRAMLKIQDGCDNFCAYCVIPRARGRVRSLPVDACADAARELDDHGYREIVITGIEICSYGKDIDAGLTDALSAISAAAPHARLRLGSLEPSCVTESFVAALAALPNLCDHFHLSLQSGSDDVLRRMRRRYTTAEFSAALGLLRKNFPNCGVTADVIAGFPGETDAQHAETAAFLQKCAFSQLHVFPYSRRPGTPAAAMENQLPNAVKKSRAAELRAIGGQTRAAFLASQLGKTLDVLFEREADGASVGHSGNYLEITERVTGARGKILPVLITAEKIPH
ncbi:MAG: tRNA (N(6)-L-threonylcarbamoyladenosine(37)-C(2))-methylthiotransferase MtaB [Oscillospiraceae bacterium]|nr:tRNA (N(6)-L-threonylcarbamoyladenosine(37)-C(2))-methylthiotransferase MtaB [Oscillospiraceae bacterium]